MTLRFVARWGVALSLAACQTPATPGSPTVMPTETLAPEETFTGLLEQGDWAKTAESYCQAGSDYYALTVGADRYLLNSERDQPFVRDHQSQHQAMQAHLATLVGQTITVRGQLITRAFAEEEHCPDPMDQCVQGPMTCTWVRVTTVATP